MHSIHILLGTRGIILYCISRNMVMSWNKKSAFAKPDSAIKFRKCGKLDAIKEIAPPYYFSF